MPARVTSGTSALTAWFRAFRGNHSLTVVAPIGAARVSKRSLITAAMCAAAAYAQPAAPSQPAPRQIDIGAERAPLTEVDRTDLADAIAAHNWSAEKVVLDRVTAAHPDSLEIYIMTGRLAYLEHHPAEAAAALEHADRLKPLAESDRLTLALADEFSGHPVPARAEMLKLTRAAPNKAEYFYLLGRIDRQNEKMELAVADQRRAVALDPNQLRAYQELGQLQEQLGNIEEARKTYETALKRNRLQKIPWEWPPVDLGAVLLKLEKPGEAESLFREALQYKPRFGWAHYYLGRVFQQKGKDQEAIEEYRAAVVHEPTLRQAWLALGREDTRMGNKAEADRALAVFKKLEDQENARKYAGKK